MKISSDISRCTASKPSCTRLPWTERSVKKKSESSIFNGASNMFQHQSLKLPSPTTPAIIISAPGFFVSKKLLQLFNVSAFFWKNRVTLPGSPGKKTQRKPVRSSPLSFPGGHRSFERSAGRWPSFGRAGPRGRKNWRDGNLSGRKVVCCV